MDISAQFWTKLRLLVLCFPDLMENSFMLVMSNYNHQADETKKWFYVL